MGGLERERPNTRERNTASAALFTYFLGQVLVPDHPRKSRFPGGRNSACPWREHSFGSNGIYFGTADEGILFCLASYSGGL